MQKTEISIQPCLTFVAISVLCPLSRLNNVFKKFQCPISQTWITIGTRRKPSLCRFHGTGLELPQEGRLPNCPVPI